MSSVINHGMRESESQSLKLRTELPNITPRERVTRNVENKRVPRIDSSQKHSRQLRQTARITRKRIQLGKLNNAVRHTLQRVMRGNKMLQRAQAQHDVGEDTEPIIRQVEELELRARGKTRRERGEAVVVEVEDLELGQEPHAGGQARERGRGEDEARERGECGRRARRARGARAEGRDVSHRDGRDLPGRVQRTKARDRETDDARRGAREDGLQREELAQRDVAQDFVTEIGRE